MLLRLLDWFLGYVTVEIMGESTEQFMNLCAVHKKDVWDFTVSNGLIRAKVRLSEIKALRGLARKAKVRIRIAEKHGLWFVANPFRKRWGLLIGGVAFFFILWFLSGRIWYIQVQGNKNISIDQIQQMLQESGVYQGISAKEYDWATLRQSILTKYPEISWMSLNPQGCLLYVDMNETITPPEMKENQEPCNLVAIRDGRIVGIKVFSGKATVKEGDAVVKGDVLISGVVEYSDGSTVFRRASGEVMAETKHTKTITVPLKQTVVRRTGEVKTKNVFSFFGLDIPLYLGSVSTPYEKEIIKKHWELCNVPLPLGVKTARFYPTVEAEQLLTQQEAMQQGREMIQAQLEEEYGDSQVKNVEYFYHNTSDSVVVKSEFFCIENIIFCEKLLIF